MSRWSKLLSEAGRRAPKASSQYTNLSLAPIWEKLDVQDQLLMREAWVPLMSESPEVLLKYYQSRAE